jgi:molybdopterin synthase catalytic subunit
LFLLTWESIDSRKIADGLKSREDGALVMFEGMVRDNSQGKKVRFLEYDAYESMALKKLEELGAQARQQFDIRDVAIVHRLGHMEIGECSVVIAIASAHRGPAFDACRFLIDTLKKVVPIWKKEFYEDGEVWIEGPASN